MDFSSTVEGGDAWNSPPMSDGPVATITGVGGAETMSDTTHTSTGGSPLSEWLDATRWSREDLRLLTDLIGALGTLGALWVAFSGVKA